MTTLLWIGGLLGIGALGFVALNVWGLLNHPDRPSHAAYREGLNVLHSDLAVTNAVIRALNSMPAAFNTPPDVDDYDESFLRHIDESHGLIRIRTQEMCEGDLTPQFIIETPTAAWASFETEPFDFEGEPFDSAESELDHYLEGARRIAEALVDEGLERLTDVTINDKNYSL